MQSARREREAMASSLQNVHISQKIRGPRAGSQTHLTQQALSPISFATCQGAHDPAQSAALVQSTVAGKRADA